MAPSTQTRLSCVWLPWLFMTLVGCHAFDWVEVPGTVHACVGGQADFPWRYDPDVYTISMAYWRFRGTGKTVLGHHILEDRLVYYESNYARSRVALMDPDRANAGLTLKDIRTSDAGMYRVELSGAAGAEDESELIVYTDGELMPTIQLDNEDVSMATIRNISSCSFPCIIVLTTGRGLSGDITITLSDGEKTECKAQTTCSLPINMDHDRPTNLNLTFDVDYGFCKAKTSKISLTWGSGIYNNAGQGSNSGKESQMGPEEGDDEKGSFIDINLIIGVVIGSLITIIVLLIIAVILLYRRTSGRQKRGKDLSARQEQFVSTVQKWKQVARDARRTRSKAAQHPDGIRRSFSEPATDNSPTDAVEIPLRTFSSKRSLETKVNIEPLPEDKLLDRPEAERDDPDGEDGPKVVTDPDHDSSESGKFSRMDSEDSVARSYVFVERSPDGKEATPSKVRKDLNVV